MHASRAKRGRRGNPFDEISNAEEVLFVWRDPTSGRTPPPDGRSIEPSLSHHYISRKCIVSKGVATSANAFGSEPGPASGSVGDTPDKKGARNRSNLTFLPRFPARIPSIVTRTASSSAPG